VLLTEWGARSLNGGTYARRVVLRFAITIGICAGLLSGCGGLSSEEVERSVADQMDDRVACIEMADGSYKCTGEEDDYRARVTSDGERVVVRESSRRRGCRYGACGKSYGGD
jgi:hypothetical protein